MRKPTDLRQKVLDASLALLEEGGLDRFSMREVARKAGVSHQAPYHHFADRETILAALAGEGFAKLTQDVERATAKAGGTTEVVGAIARAYVDFAMRHPAYFRVMFSSDAVPLANHKEAKKEADAAFDTLLRAIDKAFAAESAETRKKIALGCWAFTHGLATLMLEGTLASRVGAPKAQQKKIADGVIAAFSDLLWRRGG